MTFSKPKTTVNIIGSHITLGEAVAALPKMTTKLPAYATDPPTTTVPPPLAILYLINKQSAIVDDLEKQNNLLSRVTDNVSLQGLREAMELQQVRRREALLRESKKERELQREQGLIAKPTSPSLFTKDN
uniref:Uncharacterized protein n=1 Tax=Timema monikensis TaxID=170555 RepID=A0A7R9HNC5_9NEOP|nr:unnamed protein product [Timema monikensis]